MYPKYGEGGQQNDQILCMTMKGGLKTLPTLIVKFIRRRWETNFTFEWVYCTIYRANENRQERKKPAERHKATALRQMAKEGPKHDRRSESLEETGRSKMKKKKDETPPKIEQESSKLVEGMSAKCSTMLIKRSTNFRIWKMTNH